MGLATSFLAGSKEEWSLVRRHPSEGIFGVQLAGNKPATLVPATEAIARECGPNIDFVDLNCGCPIDLVFKSGSGSAREFHQRGTFSPFHSNRVGSSELRGWEWRASAPSRLPLRLLFFVHPISSLLPTVPAFLMPTNRVPSSVGRARKVTQDPYRDEQGTWRSSCDDQASNWCEGWPQHSAQAHASDRFGMGYWVHDCEQYLLFSYSTRDFDTGSVASTFVSPLNLAFT